MDFLGLLPSALLTTHLGQGDATGPSPRILACVSGQAQAPDGQDRLFKGCDEDFDGQFSASGSGSLFDRLTVFLSGAGTLASADDEYGGVAKCTAAAAANAEVTIKSGVVGALSNYQLSQEVRQSVAPAEAYFFGLADPGAAATGVIAAGGADLADANFFGFFHPAGGPLQFVTRKTGAATVVLADLGAVEAGWAKLGFIYGRRSNSNTGVCDVYVNNNQVANFEDADLKDAEVPKDIPLALVTSMRTASASGIEMLVDFMYSLYMMK